MPAERIAMQNIKELLRLKYDCALSHERIARAVDFQGRRRQVREGRRGQRRELGRNRSLSGVLCPPAPTRNNPSHIHQGGAGSDQGDSDQQQVAAA